MAIYDLYSRRQRKFRGESVIYQYDYIPSNFRVQVSHIAQELEDEGILDFHETHKLLCKEYGYLTLGDSQLGIEDCKSVFQFFQKTNNYEECLDILELVFRKLEENLDKYTSYKDRSVILQDKINELNQRLKEWGIGYEFQNGELIRIDSQFIHSETVKPILVLLANEKYYEGVNQEFLKAHEHYRHKRYKECLVECCKSFESLMKAICEKRKWDYKPTDTASKLIKTCFENKLIPSYMDNQIASLKQILESGVPTIRNKEGGHGQGAEIIEVSEHLASYCLHLTASNLLFLANCEKQLP